MSKVWFITGSSRGLGRTLAEAVLAAGHQLVASARNPKQLDDLVQRYGQQIRPVALDVSDADAATKAVQTAIDAFGRIDVVVNNAGYANVDSFEDMTPAIAPLAPMLGTRDPRFRRIWVREAVNPQIR